jgi:two-component system response regulator
MKPGFATMSGSAAEILIVDDNPSDCGLALEALKGMPPVPRVAIVHDGAEALDYLFCTGDYADRADTTPPKLVILDLNMPVLSGMEVLRQIRADPGTMDIAVVVLTGGYRAEEIRQAQKLGVTSYFLKPSDYREYMEMLRVIRANWL